MSSKLVLVVCPAHQLNPKSIIVLPCFCKRNCELGGGSIEVNERVIQLISDL